MSGKSSAVMFVFALAIAFASFRAENGTSLTSSASRGPSSIASVGLKRIKHTSKLRGPLSASLELVGKTPEAPGDVFVLKGIVSSYREASNVEFAWALPEGIELVNGERNGVISSLTPDKPFEVVVTLRQIGDSNAQIHLQVSTAIAGGTRFADTAQFNTLLEEAFKQGLQDLKQTTEAYEAEKAKQ